MRLLLDTQVVLWQFGAVRPPGPTARAALAEATDVVVSAVTFAEIGIKAARGKLKVPERLEEGVAEDGIRVLGLTAADGLALEHLPLLHRDPFDRLLVVQAQRGDYTLMTSDADIARYDVRVLDPRG